MLVITDETPASDAADILEARARRLMAERAAMPCTWQTRGRIAELWVEINAALDEWLKVRAQEHSL